MRVEFTDLQNLGKAEAVTLVERTRENGLAHLIVVSGTGFTPLGKAELLAANATVELFTLSELSFNLLAHEHVPLHQVLSTAQRDEILQKHNCTLEQLPKIKRTDPVMRWLGVRQPGTVIQVTRCPNTPQEEISYRAVV